MLHKEFTVDGLDYVLQIGEAGDVCFALVGGASKKGSARKADKYDLFRDEPRLEDVELSGNVFAVFRKIKEIVLEYVYRAKPWRISFYANSPRKTAIYRRIAFRVIKNLYGFNLVEAPEGTFSLYKLVSKAVEASHYQRNRNAPEQPLKAVYG